MSTVNIDQKLSLNKFHVDEENAHIVLKQEIDMEEFQKLMLACPAGLYKMDDNGDFHFDYAGCFECGTCRVLCGTTVLEKWEYPAGALGVEFRWG